MRAVILSEARDRFLPKAFYRLAAPGFEPRHLASAPIAYVGIEPTAPTFLWGNHSAAQDQ